MLDKFPSDLESASNNSHWNPNVLTDTYTAKLSENPHEHVRTAVCTVWAETIDIPTWKFKHWTIDKMK